MATQREVKDAFDRLSAELHPDKNPSSPDAAEKFKAVSAAYDILGSPEKRSVYNAIVMTGFFISLCCFLGAIVCIVYSV